MSKELTIKTFSKLIIKYMEREEKHPYTPDMYLKRFGDDVQIINIWTGKSIESNP